MPAVAAEREFSREKVVMRRVKRNPRKGGIRTCPEARRKRSSGEGFTIIEIVIVLAIIGILAAIAVPAYRNYLDRSLVKLCIKNIRLLENAIKIYELENMRLPNALNDLGPVEFLNQNGNSIRQSPPFPDPYGNPFRYLNFAKNRPGGPTAARTGSTDL
jgi:type II secretion system protein G